MPINLSGLCPANLKVTGDPKRTATRALISFSNPGSFQVYHGADIVRDKGCLFSIRDNYID